MKRYFTTSILLGTAMTIPSLALAQTTEPAGNSLVLEEIVVTAQKRAEPVQDVPISISALDTNMLEQAGITTPTDLQRLVPTLKYSSSIGTLAARFSIRGIGTFGNSAIEPSVASFIDGIYIPRPASIINSMLDVGSVEVLSGPQGTLFGRNASAGAISYNTGAPTGELSASIKADYSTGEHFRLENVINAPLNDKVAVRVAGLADLFGGYWQNDLDGKRFGGMDTYQGRVSVKSDISDAMTWNVRAEFQKNKGDGLLNAKLLPNTVTPTTLARVTAIQNGIAPDLNLFNGHNNDYNDGAYVDDQIWGLSSDLSYTTGGDYTIRMLNGYWNWNSDQGDGDTSSMSVPILGRDLRWESRSNSHELQFISPKNELLDGKLDFVAGLYYFNEDLGILANSNNLADFCRVVVGAAPGAFPLLTGDKVAACRNSPSKAAAAADFDQETSSIASYAQATYALTDSVSFTGGLRWTDEDKDGTYVGRVTPAGSLYLTAENTALKLEDSRLTWRANLSYRPNDDSMLFATMSTGFKSGGFNSGGAPVVLGQQRIFNAETITNYELGAKTEWLYRSLTVNATLYRMDIDDFQERSIQGLISTIRNVGKVRHQGVELDAVARPTDYLRLNASIAYLDSEIRSYPGAPTPPYVGGTQNLAGARLNYTPKWSGVVGAEFNGDFGDSGYRWVLNGDVNFTSKQQQGTTIDNGQLTVQSGYALLNARVTIHGPDDAWSLSAYGRNLTDKGYCASTVYQVLDGVYGMRYAGGTAVRCNVGAPQVFGMSLGANF